MDRRVTPIVRLGRERSGHPDSALICTLADVAEHHGARWVMFENVCELLSKLKSFFGTVKQYFRGKEHLQIAAGELHHQELGGMTRRSRVWPVFENAGVTGLLPPWNSSTSCVAAGRVRTYIHTFNTKTRRPNP